MKVGFASSGNKVVDATNKKADMILIGGGEYENMSLAEEVGGSTLLGGTGNDTVIAGNGDYIDAGAGKNFVQMSDNGGSTVNFAAGKTTLDNFNFVEDVTEDVAADKLQTGALAISDIKVEDGDVVIKTDNGNVTINDAEGKTIAFQNQFTNGKAINLSVGEKELDVLNDGLYWATGSNATLALSKDYETAEGVEVAAIDLNNSNYNEAGLSFFGNVKEFDASEFEGKSNIAAQNNGGVIRASNGGSTITGGAGNDTFVGGEGADEFIVSAGKNSISGFDVENDKLNLETAAIQGITAEGNAIVLQTENGSVKVDNLKGKTFQFANEYTNNQNINLTAGDNALAVEDNGLYWAAGKKQRGCEPFRRQFQ